MSDRKEYMKRWRAENPHIWKRSSRRWKLNNRSRVLQHRKNANRSAAAYQRKRRESPEARVLDALRGRIRKVVKGFKVSARTRELLGCDQEFLRVWLTLFFQPGMSWENYGKWELDHIEPCASFDLSDPEQQKLCFHYTNLQPLWASENRRKGDKILA